MSTNLSPEEREILRTLDNSVAAEFLRERLEAARARIGQREEYLGEAYPEGTPRQSGEEDVTEVYRQEQRILEELLAREGTDLAVDLRHRLERAQERWQQFDGAGDWPIRSAAERRRRLAAWTEERILADLVRSWDDWLMERQSVEPRDRRGE